ncbi:MAG: NERD domain-containing protein [Henriciella sp.]|nr:NERD domain-containing protein [Henriciella sp.]
MTGGSLQELFLLGPLAFLLIAFWLTRSQWSKGKIGEMHVNKALKKKLNKKEYRLLADLTLPTWDGDTTQIDHVVISQYGVFVIETKNMSGWIFGDAKHAEWTQVMFNWQSKFQNPLRQNYRHVKTIQQILGLADHQVHNFVVFVGTGEPKTDMPRNVAWSSGVLVHLIKAEHRVVLEHDSIDTLTSRLTEARLKPGKRTNRRHAQNVLRKSEDSRAITERCPRCGSRMVERINKTTGEVFLGCSTYPKCRASRNSL